jgi:topoisomerase-4 subunit B
MISSRNVYLQAIFSLRGKIENVFGKKRADIYKKRSCST